MKKGDIILIIVCILIGITGCLFFVLSKREAGYVSITKADGSKEFYSLATDGEIIIETDNGGRNVLVIHNGTADITAANCPNQDCVTQKEISLTNESIVCLPHKLVISICDRQEENDTDAIAY